MSAEGTNICLILAVVAGTMLTRFLPFLIFPAGKETPPYIEFLGKTLPYATMSLLVVYCLKDVRIFAYPYGLPELIAVFLTGLLHWWKGSSLLSIGAGTVIYMFLTQVILLFYESISSR